LASHSAIHAKINGEHVCFSEEYDRFKLLCRNFLPIHSVIFNRQLISMGCCFDQTLELYEDWDFFIQLSMLTDIIDIDAVTGFYNPGSSGAWDNDGKVDYYTKLIHSKWKKQLSNDNYHIFLKNVDELISSKEAIVCEKNSMIAEIDKLKYEINKLDKDLSSKVFENESIKKSYSWIITSPLRLFFSYILVFYTYIYKKK
jgi:hypothetical protein